MGKKSRIKKERQQAAAARKNIKDQIFKKADPLSPELIEAYTRGREVGRQQGRKEGRAQGIEEAILLHAEWIESIDEIPEIGQKRKLAIFQYFNDKAKEYVQRVEEAENE